MRRLTSILALLVGGWTVAAVSSVEIRAGQAQRSPATTPSSPKALVDQYCITCHNQRLRTAGLALDTLDAVRPSANPEIWERVIGSCARNPCRHPDGRVPIPPPIERSQRRSNARSIKSGRRVQGRDASVPCTG